MQENSATPRGPLEPLARLALAGAGAALLLLTLVEAWQVFARYVVQSPPGWTEPVALLFLKFALMLGAAVGVRDETHFRFLLGLQAAAGSAQKALQAAARLTAAALGLALSWWGARMMLDTWSVQDSGRAAADRVVFRAVRDRRSAVRGLRRRTPRLHGGARLMVLALLFGVFAILLALGVPVAFALCAASLATIIYLGLPADVFVIETAAGTDSTTLIAIPLFILAGQLMLHGGISAKLIAFAASLVGHVRGGLGQVNVLSCLFFGGVSGSAIADVSAIGGSMIPQMVERGYDRDYAVNVTISAALVALLVPPSHNLVLYSAAAGGGISIADLFAAGVIPALLLMIAIMVTAYLIARRRGYATETFPGFGAVATRLVAALPGLLLVFLIFGGIRAGIFTAVESAAIAVLYAIAVTALLYRNLPFAEFAKAVASAAQTASIILFVISSAAAFGWLLAYLQVPAAAVAAIRTIADDPLTVLILMNVVLLVLGTFMDMAPLIIICTPIFLPVATAFGVNPLQFGMVLILNAGIGLDHAARRFRAVRRHGDRQDRDCGGDADDLAVLWRGAGGAAARHLSAAAVAVVAGSVAMTAPAATLADILAAGPVIAVVTIERAADAEPVAAALQDGGVRVVEVTLRTRAGLAAIEAIAAAYPDVIVGAGTVRRAADFRAARAAGARFGVSPGFSPALAQAAAAAGIPWLPGVATASEVLAAQDVGLDHLKLFPAEPDGAARLRAFAAVFPEVVFCPTGGITPEQAPRYLVLPNVACVGGGWLTPASAIDARDWDKIRSLAVAASRLTALRTRGAS